MADIKHWITLTRIPNLGTVKFRLLERYFSSLDEAWMAGLGELKAAGLDDKTARAIVSHRAAISPDGEMEKLERAGVKAINWHDSMYPPRLKEIADPPPVLYVRGGILPEDQRSVAVVGTRKATAYGREVAGALSKDLSRNGVTVVSGLARGIDSVAHRAALESGGRTIAVFGSGLDVVYPPEHGRLARDIEESGALVSEHPLGAKPEARHFPRRNRLISGMTLGTLVVEAGDISGALLTVRSALEQDREVFCVPGSIFSPASRGTNSLIQDGAKLVTNYKDVLEELNLTVVAHQIEMRSIIQPQGDNESLLLNHVTHEPVHIDEIRRQAGLPITVVSSTLAVMELKGVIKQVGGMRYIRIREALAEYGN
jgi:DNA processing protein